MLQLQWLVVLLALPAVRPQALRQVAQFTEVYAWRQLTFNIDGVLVTSDRDDQPSGRSKRQDDAAWNWGVRRPGSQFSSSGQQASSSTQSTRPTASSTSDSDEGRFFIQYNNVPMGVERVGNRLFVTIPRRRWGIPATLNYIDLDEERTTRSPALKPYPDMEGSKVLTSVYRTRADQCGRLWMVDTGRMELPTVQRQLRTPAIVIFDLNTNTVIRRYELKPSDVPAENTPTGFASITVDITDGNCADAYAYVPDLTTFGMVVYSLRENDSWRHSHNYYSFNPVAGNLNIADQSFQWSDGVFSVVLAPGTGSCKTAYFHSLIGTHEFAVSTCVLKNRTAISDRNYFSQYSFAIDLAYISKTKLVEGPWDVFSVVLAPGTGSCKTAYFHSLIGTHEFAVSTCVLKNRTAISDRNYFSQYSVVGDRGQRTQSTMADYHPASRVMFFAEIGRDAVSCWNTGVLLSSSNVAVLARDSRRVSYPSDLHVTGDDVWVMANTLPRFGYSRLNTNDYNFYVYRANVYDAIAGTVCSSNTYPYRSGFNDTDTEN